MKKELLCMILLCVGSISFSLAQTSSTTKASAGFDKLKSLAGDWEGTFAWSGGRNASGKMDAQYYTTGKGSAIVENLIQEGTPVMTTVYHLDGDDLRMTHFCAAQNQPRLKATAFEADGNGVTFSFVDITNLRSLIAGHVHSLEVRFLDADHITLKFHFKADKESDELIDLRRKK